MKSIQKTLIFLIMIAVNMHRQIACMKNANNNVSVKATNESLLDFLAPYQKHLQNVQDLLIDGQLDAFDALVQDSACHARVPEIIAIYQFYVRLTECLNLLIDDDKIKKIIKVYLETEFLQLCRLLTITKSVLRNSHGVITNQRTIFKQLCNSLSKNKGNSLILKTQRRLAQLSVETIQKEASLLKDLELSKAVSDQACRYDNDQHHKRLHGPWYATFKVMLLSCLANNISLVIKLIQQHAVEYFFYESHNNKYVLAHHCNHDKKQAVVVIEAYRGNLFGLLTNTNNRESKFCSDNSKKYFSDIDIMQALLLNVANHPQYVGNLNQNEDIPYSKLGLINLKYEIEQLRKNSYGYTRESPSIFVIRHVYAQTLGHILNEPEIQKNQLIRKCIAESISNRIAQLELHRLICEYTLGFTM